MPFSALVAELVEDSLDPRILSYVGAIDDDLYLSMRVEEIPVRHLRSAQPSSAVEMDGPRP
jgi:hypothetical protein